MSQPDEDGFNEAPPPAPWDRYDLDEMREWSPERLRAFLATYSHLDRPAIAAGGSPRLTDETPVPALDLFGRLAR